MLYSHRNIRDKFLVLLVVSIVSGCAAVVEPVKLPVASPNSNLQETFSIDALPLTFTTAKELNLEQFPRLLSSPGNTSSAKVIDEKSIESSQFPPASATFTYLLGIGDELSFTQSMIIPGELVSSPALTEDGTRQINISQEVNQLIKTNTRVGSDGSILLIGVGRLEAKGREIGDLREEVRSILIRNGKVPDFQLDIEKFNSQKIFLTSDRPTGLSASSLIFPITDQGFTLRAAITSAGLPFNERLLTLVKIQRGSETFQFTLSDVLSEQTPDIYLRDNDHILIQNLEYRSGKVFLAGSVKPLIIPIKPEERQTLAEVLFTPGGPLEVEVAQRSAVYLLRGQNPVKAYHLDAQNPARILVADTVELRPNDIVFVGEQPISTFNRVLSTILPLRIFSRDVKNDNIP